MAALAFIALSLSGLLSHVALGAPPWAMTDTFRKQGNILRVVCSGEGADIGKAREAAVTSCVQTAAAQLPTVWIMSSKTRETDFDVSLKRQILADQKIEGLNCEIEKETMEETERTVRVYTLCKFDLATARSRPLELERATTCRAVTVKSVPPCDEIKVYGGPYGRYVKCGDDSTTVTLAPEEHSISISKQGYYYKDVKLQEEVTYQSLTIFLEKIGKPRR